VLRTLGPMIFDGLSWLFFVVLVSPPMALCGALLWRAYEAGVPIWLLPALVPALVPLFLVALCLTTWLARLLVPRPRPGDHAFPISNDAVRWALHFALRRVLLGPPWERWIMGTNVLRWTALHALGARTSLSAMMSSDVAILDGWGLHVGPESMVGAECSIACHMIVGDRLIVAPVHLARRAQIRGGAKIASGVTVGDSAVVGPLCRLRPNASVGAKARLGMQVDVGVGATIGAGARVGDRAVIEAGAVVADGARVPPDGRVSNSGSGR
jgi:acetyltransferase-like isoleucine patch superfamily enzyme